MSYSKVRDTSVHTIGFLYFTGELWVVFCKLVSYMFQSWYIESALYVSKNLCHSLHFAPVSIPSTPWLIQRPVYYTITIRILPYGKIVHNLACPNRLLWDAQLIFHSVKTFLYALLCPVQSFKTESKINKFCYIIKSIGQARLCQIWVLCVVYGFVFRNGHWRLDDAICDIFL